MGLSSMIHYDNANSTVNSRDPLNCHAPRIALATTPPLLIEYMRRVSANLVPMYGRSDEVLAQPVMRNGAQGTIVAS
jgi:hypothetical protein